MNPKRNVDEATDNLEAKFSSSDPLNRVKAARMGHFFGKKYIHKLRKLLDDTYYEVRSYAAYSLGKLEDKDSVNLIIKLLNDDFDEVRFYAVEALGSINDLSAIRPLIQTLSDPSKEVRRRSIVALSKFDQILVRDDIMRFLNTLQPDDFEQKDIESIKKIEIARGSIRALERFDSIVTEKPISFALSSPDPELFQIASVIIGNKKLHDHVGILLSQKFNVDDDIRWSVIYALTRLQFVNKSKILIKFVNDSNQFIREQLALHCSLVWNKKDQPYAIEQLINDPSVVVRIGLCKGLRGNKNQTKYFDALMKDRHFTVRQEAAISLGYIKNQKSKTILTERLVTEEDDLVKINILNSLKMIELQTE